ncbi:hypothetical protein CEXT_213491 [Caerostris extrusa]|uniref:Uncharacterized protein n=1 Tax=Caerostris extrusa TaxID=172846 RepID=A0AAV4REW0_CAEEX|nr:hypothetical protein CEXT_213491 [Caerostris extrusa]
MQQTKRIIHSSQLGAVLRSISLSRNNSHKSSFLRFADFSATPVFEMLHGLIKKKRSRCSDANRSWQLAPRVSGLQCLRKDECGFSKSNDALFERD